MMKSLVQIDSKDLKQAAAQLQEAAAAKKCWPCGCLRGSLGAIEQAFPAGERPAELAEKFEAARSRMTPIKYDCLGCEVCFPALALNALKVEGDTCPTGPAEERRGWPPLPGDYKVIRYGARVAVCTLNSERLATRLADIKPNGLSIVGTLKTENLGIERVIRNTLANPNIRFLLLCGEDTQQTVGHLPGQSLQSLVRNGLDAQGRIVGAKGKRPVLKNVSRKEVEAFIEQVELTAMIGEKNAKAIAERICACAERETEPYSSPIEYAPVKHIRAREPQRLTLDKAGYFVVYPDARTRRLVVEHYTNQGVLNCVLEGGSSAALYSEAIDRRLVTRLDHAAYLGRELARAERAIETGEVYVQDRAPGELEALPDAQSACQCADLREGECQ